VAIKEPGEEIQPVEQGSYHTRILLPVLLFILTVFTTMTAGALYEGADLFNDTLSILKGLPFCASLLLILGTHEFGHYIASRMHKVVSTLPFFIPAPPVPPMIGTFGAVIRMKTPITTKNALVDIGAAGPLVGFVFAVIVMIVGMHFSTIAPIVHDGSVAFGEPIIEKLLIYFMMGEIPNGYELVLHPVAFAGWIGFFVTALNLLPIGQLDGGHIMYAIFGPDHRKVTMGAVAILVVMGITFWPGWILWAIMVTIIGTRHPPIYDQYVPMDPARGFVCMGSILVFVLTFTPTPFYIN